MLGINELFKPNSQDAIAKIVSKYIRLEKFWREVEPKEIFAAEPEIGINKSGYIFYFKPYGNFTSSGNVSVIIPYAELEEFIAIRP